MISHVTTNQQVRLQDTWQRCVQDTAHVLRRSITSFGSSAFLGPFGHRDALGRQLASVRQSPTRKAHTTRLSLSRAEVCQWCGSMVCQWGVNGVSMVNHSECAVKLHSNSLCCHNSSFPPQLALLSPLDTLF